MLLTNPTEILGDENGWVKGMKCVKMELGEPDASGRRRPVEVEGFRICNGCRYCNNVSWNITKSINFFNN